MNYIVTPQAILEGAQRIEGANQILDQHTADHIAEMAEGQAEELAYSWDRDHGFGSSDFTFLVGSFLRSLSYKSGYQIDYSTGFLRVIAA